MLSIFKQIDEEILKFERRVKMFGIFLVVLGVLFLLQNLGIITGSFWGILWPVLIVILGIYLVTKGKKF